MYYRNHFLDESDVSESKPCHAPFGLRASYERSFKLKAAVTGKYYSHCFNIAFLVLTTHMHQQDC